MSVDTYTLTHLKEEFDHGRGGLRIYADTAWGWQELKVAPFLRYVEKHNREGLVFAITEIRRNGSASLKLPRRI
jgi:hypothetical protein